MRTISALIILFGVLLAGCGKPSEQSQNKSVEENTTLIREAFDAKKYPGLDAVGRIDFLGKKKRCTLVLVGRDVAITAGHCFLEEKYLSDMTKTLDESFTSVAFRVNGRKRLENIFVKRVLKAKMDPDYAIVRLNREITGIKPIGFDSLFVENLSERVGRLGCAAFNGDSELGDNGFTMTISRNIRIIEETPSKERIDTNCISTHGGSGGAFFEETSKAENNQKAVKLLGVIWGVTNDVFNEKGERVIQGESVTSITPVSVFHDDLVEILEMTDGKS